MSQTPRLNLQYPDEGENPFFLKISSFFESLDTYIHANLSDRNLVFSGGGELSFVSSSGLVTWGSDLKLLDTTSGFVISIVASNLTLADGEAAFIDTSRVMSQSVSAALNVAPVVGVGAGKIVLFVRQGTLLYFRNGVVLSAGVTASILESGGGTGQAKVGTETFSGGAAFVDVTFTEAYADAAYRVVGLVCDEAFALYAPAADKIASGFRIQTVAGTNPSAAGIVDWKVER